MKYKKLGKTDMLLSVVGLGTWSIGGGPSWGDSDYNQSVKAIQAAIDKGVNLIDTSPVYGWGHSEKIIGKTIKGQRNKVILSTKCGLWWKDDNGNESKNTVKRCLTPETIVEELEDSLTRMGTDYIDLYHTHWQSLNPSRDPISETMECLMKLKQEGKIRAIAASNVDLDHIKEYQTAGVLDAIQPRYSMLDRKIEEEITPYCHKNNISILVYSPLEQGLLTGKIDMNQMFQKGSSRNTIPWYQATNRQKVLNMLKGWSDLLIKYNCSMSQLVIAWTIAQKGITCALCGARKEAHARDNAGASDFEIEEDDLNRIRQDVEEKEIN
jgi:methylglyoxal reductase